MLQHLRRSDALRECQTSQRGVTWGCTSLACLRCIMVRVNETPPSKPGRRPLAEDRTAHLPWMARKRQGLRVRESR